MNYTLYEYIYQDTINIIGKYNLPSLQLVECFAFYTKNDLYNNINPIKVFLSNTYYANYIKRDKYMKSKYKCIWNLWWALKFKN